MAQATINAARKLPRSSKSTTTTSTAPSDKLRFTVPTVRSTKLDRSYTTWTSIPRGRRA